MAGKYRYILVKAESEHDAQAIDLARFQCDETDFIWYVSLEHAEDVSRCPCCDEERSDYTRIDSWSPSTT